MIKRRYRSIDRFKYVNDTSKIIFPEIINLFHLVGRVITPKNVLSLVSYRPTECIAMNGKKKNQTVVDVFTT